MDLGKTTRRLARFGDSNQIVKLPATHRELYRSFAGGFDASTNRESLNPNSSPFAINTIVTKYNRLRMIEGSDTVENFTTHIPNYVAVQSTLDFTAEVIFFAAPFLGVKRVGPTVWVDVGLGAGPYAYAVFGGVLVFTDGENVYARQPNDDHVLELLEEAPVARTYTSWAGRVWAGAALIDGNFEPLGVRWSAASSQHGDWTGLGSGFELLIDDMTTGDRVVALRPIGLDFMVILLRNSIWVATRTTNPDRPGDFKSVTPGLGAVTDPVCRMTPLGVMFLSDSGVYSFDGNTPRHVSERIDSFLLPLDYDNLDAYWATYDAQKGRYYLHTPCDTWIYELAKERWFRSSMCAEMSYAIPQQIDFIAWEDLIGSWNDQAPNRWIDYRGIAEGATDMYFVGQNAAGDWMLDIRDVRKGVFFGDQFEAIWEMRPISDEYINKLITMKMFLVEYVGFGRLVVWAPNIYGVYEPFALGDLPQIADPDVAVFKASKTGRILGIQLRFCAPWLEIVQVETIGQLRSERIEQIDGPHYPVTP